MRTTIRKKTWVWALFVLLNGVIFGQNPCTDQNNIKYVRVNIHYVLRSDGTGNFTETSDGWGNNNFTGFDYAQGMIDSGNAELAVNPGVALPNGNTFPINDFGYRLVLSGVYFHRDDAIYNYYDQNYNGTAGGSSLWSFTYNSFLVNPSTEINYFFFNTANAPQLKLQGIAAGIGTPTNQLQAKQFNAWYTYKYGANAPTWVETPEKMHRFENRTFMHELGHCMGLYHTWNQNDFCTDTPQNPGCWEGSNTPTNPCYWGNVTNNLMDYNGYDDWSLSPQQINKVHTNLSGSLANYVEKCGTCQPAQAFLYAAPTQCKPVAIDGTGSYGEDRHFIEIYEVTAIGSTTVVAGTYYSNWFQGEINRIQDLGAYTGYNFQYGKIYRVKTAVQSDLTNTPNGQFCTGWDESEAKYITISSGNTCCASTLQLHAFYDINQQCITHFQAASTCPSNAITQVVFQDGTITYTDTQPTFIYYKTAGPFVGTVKATFYFADGTTTLIQLNYQKCLTQTIDPLPIRN
jgi:hypothetical protein